MRHLILLVAFIAMPMNAEAQIADDIARQVVAEHEDKVKPLEIAAALAWWNANVSGKDEDFKAKEEAQNRLDAALSDRAAFERIKGLRGKVKDANFVRAIDVLYLQYLEKQVEPALLRKITAKANAIEKAFVSVQPRASSKPGNSPR